MSPRRTAVWILGGAAAVVALVAGGLWLYNAGLRTGAERGMQASRDIGFATQSLFLRHLLSVSGNLERSEVGQAQATLNMLTYHQYTRLEEDAKGGLLEGTGRMKRNIEKVRELVVGYCAGSHGSNAEFDLCAEVAKRSNKTMEPTR
jgi:hypothetical protein